MPHSEMSCRVLSCRRSGILGVDGVRGHGRCRMTCLRRIESAKPAGPQHGEQALAKAGGDQMRREGNAEGAEVRAAITTLGAPPTDARPRCRSTLSFLRPSWIAKLPALQLVGTAAVTTLDGQVSRAAASQLRRRSGAPLGAALRSRTARPGHGRELYLQQ